MRCPLCIQVKKKIYERSAEHLDLNQLIRFLDTLPSLERINLEGNYSEPLLYPDVIKLVEYFKKRSLKIIISTNASFKTESFWQQLGCLLDAKDIIRFAIDGSNQELYSKYRVGGDLELVLKNHATVKNNSKCRTVLQHICFKYNQNDKENIKNIFYNEGFDFLNFVKCYMGEFTTDEVTPVDEVRSYYKLFNKALSAKEERTTDLICDSKIRGEIYINHRGEIFLCGSHDQGESFDVGININSPEEEIFKSLNATFNKRNQSSICQSDCNLLCYSVGRRFPDLLIDKNNNERNVKYFSKDIDECHQQIDDIFNAVIKR